MVRLDLPTVLRTASGSQSITSWATLSRAIKHRARIVKQFVRNSGVEEEIKLLFERNAARRKARREKRLKESMIIHLIRLHAQYGFTPGRAEIKKAKRFTTSQYVYHFGSTREAQIQAGLIPNDEGELGHTYARPHYSHRITA